MRKICGRAEIFWGRALIEKKNFFFLKESFFIGFSVWTSHTGSHRVFPMLGSWGGSLGLGVLDFLYDMGEGFEFFFFNFIIFYTCLDLRVRLLPAILFD